jgi:peptide/nickel transport system substrate-binding protein
MMIQRKKVLSLVMCFMMIGLIAVLTSGCGGGGGGGGGGGSDTPQYGGQLTIFATADPVSFDDCVQSHAYVTGPYQCLWGGDWAKGIAGGYGTKQCNWFARGEINRMEFKTGKIAQSWEIGDDYITFHLRDGVKFAYSATKTQAVTADDVVYSLERNFNLSTSYFKQSYPYIASATSVSKVDESTVRLDCPSQYMAELISLIEYMYIYPEDVIETYGDMNDWERAIGTGAFILTNYVQGSYLLWERNDNYWETNPVGPGQGNQLPYLDSVKTLITPDISTADSLFTTGKIDITTADYDRAQTLLALPNVKNAKFIDSVFKGVIYMRTDKSDRPYKDVRVRQALQLAIDQQKIIDEYFGGEAVKLYWPVGYLKEYAGAYMALEDYPADVQELFGYNPDKAKQLLADAGYPDGFKASIAYNTALYFNADILTMVKDMWADIGVDLTLVPLDNTTHTTQQYLRSYPDMLYGAYSGDGTYFKGINWSGTSMFNASYVDDPVLNDYRAQMLAAYAHSEAEADSIHREMLPYLEEQCYVIQTAAHYTYVFWWPWVKNYDGEGAIGYYGGASSWTPYVWIDEALKTSMGF